MDMVYQNGSNHSNLESLTLFKYIVNPNDTEYVPIGQLSADFYGVEINLQDLSLSFIPKEIKAKARTNSSPSSVADFTRANRMNNYCDTHKILYGYGISIMDSPKRARILALPSNIYKKIYVDAFEYFLDENKDVVKNIIDDGLDINNHTYLISSYFARAFINNNNLINNELTLLYFDRSRRANDFKVSMNLKCKVMDLSYNEILALTFNYGKLKPFGTFTELDELIQESIMEI